MSEGSEEKPSFLPPEPVGRQPSFVVRDDAPTQALPEEPRQADGATYRGFGAPGGAGGRTPVGPPTQPAQTAVQQPRHVEPDNGSAVAGFVLSIVSAGMLLISFGVSSIVSVLCSGLGIFYAVRGRRAIAAGRTTRQSGLAQAGYVIGIIGLAVAVLASVVYTVALIQAIQDGSLEDWWHDLERDLEDQQDRQDGGSENGEPAMIGAVRIGAVVGRLALGLIS